MSLLIATRNRRDELLVTLEAMAPTFLDGGEIIVYDDASTDGSADAVLTRFPEIQLIRGTKPIGYIEARNRLLAKACGPFALSLDDDSQLVEPAEALARIRDHFAAEPKCGVIAARVFWGRKLPKNTQTEEGSLPVRSFVGCGHVWRLEAWKQLSGYPAWYGFYGEEETASLELLRLGLQVWYLPEVLVLHRVEPTTDRPPAERRRRGRRQLRSAMYTQLLRYPLAALPSSLGRSVLQQLGRRLRRGDLAVLTDLLWVALSTLLRSPWILRDRRPLSRAQLTSWRRLTPSRIYWQPPDSGAEADSPSLSPPPPTPESASG